MALEEIIARKQIDVEQRRRTRPLDSFRDALVASDRSFEAALRRPRTGYVMECKRASPSQGRIREHFDPAEIATSYAPFADAISVLTDAPFFDGHLEYLKVVRETADVPVLCKDFVVHPYQVYEARSHDADAILLMLSVLDDETYGRCFEAARSLDIDVLTEVHDDIELDRALAHPCKPPIIGINNRNLKTLEIDLSTTGHLAARIPDDRVILCESGVKGHEDVVRLRQHADAFLVGTALMGAADLDRAIRELVFGQVKVCGLTRHQDARVAWEAGATRGGLIFAEESPRAVTLKQAQTISQGAPLGYVGVFVNEPIARVAEIADALDLEAVQLHGEETENYLRQLRKTLPDHTEIWQVVHVPGTLPELTATTANRVLFDTFAAGKRGGTGKTFDWDLLRPSCDLDRVVLSGGLKPENIRRADKFGAGVLDVNSGVESSPGIKDEKLLHELFAVLRGTGRDR